MSGGEKSLLELLAGLGTRVQATVAAPKGELSRALEAQGVPLRSIPATDGSLRPHVLHTPRAVGELAWAARAVRRIAHRDSVDLVHANSIRAGISAVAAARTGASPAIVHVRDVLPDGTLTRVTRAVVGAGASAIVGNSAFTLERFAHTRTDAVLAVAHSAINLDRLSAAAELDRGAARAALGIRPQVGPVLGVVAQLTPWKAQDDAVRIVSGLRDEHPEVLLVLVGSAKFVSNSTRHDNQAFVARIRAQVAHLGLQDRVLFLGERTDVPEVLRALDMLLVPSWEEPFGRSVVEALAVGVPVAATSAGGPREVLSDGVHGLLLPPRQPDAWVQALLPVLGDRVKLAEMSRLGRARAIAFGREAQADRVLSLYEDVLIRSSSPARRKRSRARPEASGRASLCRTWPGGHR